MDKSSLKVSLNTSPSSILHATIGQVFELDERTFLLEGGNLIYLTLLETNSSMWEEERVWVHVRNKAGYALMTRQEMYDILESSEYFVE